MTAKNFSPGDVVVAVTDPTTHWFVRGGLYTVTEAAFGYFGEPGIKVAEAPPSPHALGLWASECFRLAYRPDPEVERERTEDPIKRPVSA